MRIDYVGMKFDFLTVIGYVGQKGGVTVLSVRCVCGKTKTVFLNNLKRGSNKSCGCKKIPYTTHGLSKHPLYGIWNGMKVRCNNPNRNEITVRNYFNKGIKVCEAWSLDFKVFYDWAISKGWKKGLEIDRIDGNLGYEPSNCRIATKKMQSRNIKTNVCFVINGEKRCMSEWCEIYGMDYKLTHQRVKRDGHSFESLIEKYGKLG
jgi:hypothetical protein